MMKLLYIIPKNYLSYYLGILASIELPKPFSTWLVKTFANAYKINLQAASKDISEYKSIGDFFIRDLKSYPVLSQKGLVSPVEATLRAVGDIKQGKIVQVKDVEYSVSELLADSKVAEEFENGTYLNFYLSPTDYHQIHSPVAGEITSSTYIKGKLWPVNDWSLNTINGLFAVNERLVTYIDSEIGKVALVMVGATNVGKISVSYDDWDTNDIFNRKKLGAVNSRTYESKKTIAQGAKLGKFHMGSAVVLLINKKREIDLSKANTHVDLFTALSS